VWLEKSGSRSEWEICFEHSAETVENWTGPIVCETARMLVRDQLPNFEMDDSSISNITYSIFYDLLKWKICYDYDDEATLEVSFRPKPVSTS
jgi:hypothetical protein